MSTFPWYYIWSPKYAIFHNILYSNIYDLSGFTIHDQFFPQEFFDKGLSKDPTKHSFEGLSIKLKLLLGALHKNPDRHIIISDADLIVNRPDLLYDYLQSYIDNDIVFMKESRQCPTANIGFGMVKSSPQTIEFFQKMADHIDAYGGHDQTLYNQWINEGRFSGKVDTFSIPEVLQSNNYVSEITNNGTNPNILLQFLCSGNNYAHNTIEKLLTAIGFVDISDIIHLISEDLFAEFKNVLSNFCADHYLLSLEYPKSVST